MTAAGRFGIYGGAYVPETLVPAVEELEAAMNDALADPGFVAELDGWLRDYAGRPTPLTLARRLTGANTTTTIAFATEAGLFQAAGIPAVICGPGSIDVAHKPDEFISREQLAAGAAFLDRLLVWARRGGT